MPIGPHAQTVIIPLILESLFYGIYLVFFSAAIYVSKNRPAVGLGRVLPFAMFIMWSLSTTRIGIDTWKFYHLCKFGKVDRRCDIPLAILHTTNTLIADLVIVSRCHVLCRSSYATGISTLLFITSCVVGYVYPLSNASFALILGTHSVALALSVFHIWKVVRRIQPVGTHRSQGTTAIHVLLESGALYSLCLICLSITSGITNETYLYTSPITLPNMGTAFSSTYAITSQLVGIVPTTSTIRALIKQHCPPLSTHSIQFHQPQHTSFASTEIQSSPWLTSQTPSNSALSQEASASHSIFTFRPWNNSPGLCTQSDVTLPAKLYVEKALTSSPRVASRIIRHNDLDSPIG